MVACSARRSYCFTLQINKKYLEYQCDWLSFLGVYGTIRTYCAMFSRRYTFINRGSKVYFQSHIVFRKRLVSNNIVFCAVYFSTYT